MSQTGVPRTQRYAYRIPGNWYRTTATQKRWQSAFRSVVACRWSFYLRFYSRQQPSSAIRRQISLRIWSITFIRDAFRTRRLFYYSFFLISRDTRTGPHDRDSTRWNTYIHFFYGQQPSSYRCFFPSNVEPRFFDKSPYRFWDPGNTFEMFRSCHAQRFHCTFRPPVGLGFNHPSIDFSAKNRQIQPVITSQPVDMFDQLTSRHCRM